MNSNFGKNNNSQRGSVPLDNFDFDFGFGSGLSNNRSRPLNDQKQQTTTPYSFSSSSYSSTPSKPASSSWAPNKPSWTHQPSPSPASRSGLSNPSSMVGDISGRSWGSTGPSISTAGLGIPEKNPNLFGDLLGSALGQGKSGSNVPLKNATPASAPATSKNSFNMGNLAGSLPKTSNPKNNSQGFSENFGSFVSANNNSNNKTGNLGGTSMRSGIGVPASSKDPFGSLVDFSSKPDPKINAASNKNTSARDYSFGDFLNAPKSGTPTFPSNVFPAANNNSVRSSSASSSKMDNFGIPTQDFISQKQPPLQSTGVDPLDMLFSLSSASAAAVPPERENQPFSEVDDWGIGSEFGGNDIGGTTELEGLPPPPAGVNASIAKSKGLDNHKQGQHADAIKWLSWAVVLLEKSGDSDGAIEVLSCRASCYKEVGEYKKAITDCSKVLEHDGANVSVLIQRALLYESTEKYKLGAEDLRTVLKIDPSNRLARSTIHRLAKMAE